MLRSADISTQRCVMAILCFSHSQVLVACAVTSAPMDSDSDDDNVHFGTPLEPLEEGKI